MVDARLVLMHRVDDLHAVEVPILNCAVGGPVCDGQTLRVEMKRGDLLVRVLEASDFFVRSPVPYAQ